MMNLSKKEIILIESEVLDIARYSIHYCEEHGLHQHFRENDYTGCIYCRKICPEIEDPKSLLKPV